MVGGNEMHVAVCVSRIVLPPLHIDLFGMSYPPCCSTHIMTSDHKIPRIPEIPPFLYVAVFLCLSQELKHNIFCKTALLQFIQNLT